MRQLEQGTPVCNIWPNKTEHLLGHLYNLDTIVDLEKMEQLKDFARFGVISLTPETWGIISPESILIMSVSSILIKV